MGKSILPNDKDIISGTVGCILHMGGTPICRWRSII